MRTVGKAIAHDSAELHVTGTATYIDDMREPAKYEAYLRPILQRLKRMETCYVEGVFPHTMFRET